jgi:cytochrome P450
MIAEHGCKPCPHIYNTDNIIGLNVFLENTRNTRLRRLLPGNRARFLKQNTNTFRSRMMHFPIVATVEPENLKTILSIRFKDYSFGNRTVALTPLLGDGIFNNDGEKWANSRHLIRPNFVREQVANLEDFERHFKRLLKHIPKHGETLDIQPLFFKFTIDSATEFLFNHSTNSLRMTDEEDQTNPDAIFARAFNFAQVDVSDRLRWAFLDRFRPKRKANEAIRICHEYVDGIVDGALQWRRERDAAIAAGKKVEDDGRYVFIHELVKQTDNKERVRSELINVLLAGRDTTASLMSNALFEIAKRPHIWAKLREEVAELGGREPTYEELKNFKYVKWCLNECESSNSAPLIYQTNI